MIYQNLFPLDRQIARVNCNLFILFEQRGKVFTSIYQDFFNDAELLIKILIVYIMKCAKSPITTMALIYPELKKSMVN